VAEPGTARGSLVVTWKAPAKGRGAPITGYKVEVRRAKGPWTVAEANASAAPPLRVTLTKLASGAPYRVRVSAINSAGTSKPTTSFTARPR
jgi:hypothetical protein